MCEHRETHPRRVKSQNYSLRARKRLCAMYHHHREHIDSVCVALRVCRCPEYYTIITRSLRICAVLDWITWITMCVACARRAHRVDRAPCTSEMEKDARVHRVRVLCKAQRFGICVCRLIETHSRTGVFLARAFNVRASPLSRHHRLDVNPTIFISIRMVMKIYHARAHHLHIYHAVGWRRRA